MENSKIIVEGEASESDEDELSGPNESLDRETTATAGTSRLTEEISQNDGDKTGNTSSIVSHKDGEVSVNTGVIVSGEASESDEEFEIVTSEGQILPLNVNTSEKGDTTDLTSPQSPSLPSQQKEVKPKYNTLLNRKLRERNIALRRHIVDTIHQSYTQAATGLHNLTIQLQKSHIAIQDVSHHMRNTTNDLFQLEDKVDIVRSCNILPNITLPVKPVVPATVQS
ncbi:biogenesis of lysosome-related organelles complex 1 subunit 3-like [Ruditapes philippinarum]|uniref:biogenesis of lysosome-related organelles complex 1 subunit 3-like n=1 Tax=Ruditapes philippinarum TaxID=129788 RepID=UPI00295B1224|nr:biogenesis of lysosome-related organelles complex 1 subunit 3-like [Ruditapes philippinarum]